MDRRGAANDEDDHGGVQYRATENRRIRRRITTGVIQGANLQRPEICHAAAEYFVFLSWLCLAHDSTLYITRSVQMTCM